MTPYRIRVAPGTTYLPAAALDLSNDLVHGPEWEEPDRCRLTFYAADDGKDARVIFPRGADVCVSLDSGAGFTTYAMRVDRSQLDLREIAKLIVQLVTHEPHPWLVDL